MGVSPMSCWEVHGRDAHATEEAEQTGSLQWAIELVAHGRLAEQDGLQKSKAVGEVPFVAARFAVPRGPVDAFVGCVGDAVLDFAAGLTFEHGAEQLVAAL